jgi:hypothetical protein
MSREKSLSGEKEQIPRAFLPEAAPNGLEWQTLKVMLKTDDPRLTTEDRRPTTKQCSFSTKSG